MLPWIIYLELKNFAQNSKKLLNRYSNSFTESEQKFLYEKKSFETGYFHDLSFFPVTMCLRKLK